MTTVLEIVAPVFGLIAAGYLCARLGWIGDGVGRYINRFVFDLAIPVLLFRTMVRMSVPEVSPWALWASYFGGIAVSWAAASATVFTVLGRSAREACVTGFGSGYSNTVLLGLPLIFSFFPDGRGAVPLFIILSIHLPVMMVTGTALFEWSGRSGQVRIGALLMQTAKAMIVNPIIIGLLAGLAYRQTGLGLDAVADQILQPLAWIAVPAALFTMGLGLKKFGISGDPPASAVMLASKLVLHPLTVWLLAAWVFALPPVWIGVAVLFAAAPTGINVYLFASRYDVAVPAVSSAVMLGTAASVVTITAISWALGF